MKKLILAVAVVFGSIAFSACTKENVQPTQKAIILADKGDLGQADGDKGDLGQADGGSGGTVKFLIKKTK